MQATLGGGSFVKHVGPNTDCGGNFETWEIREHFFTFMKCKKCGWIIGGDKEKAKINKLMRTKVRPTMRRV